MTAVSLFQVSATDVGVYTSKRFVLGARPNQLVHSHLVVYDVKERKDNSFHDVARDLIAS